MIAILAAITIVAYRGIQDRAKASSASSAATQARKKVELYKAENDIYPATLAAAGLSDSGSASYQYSLNTSTNTYCITATAGNVSYYVNNSAVTGPTAGGCAGHGQGGVAAVTNLALNPTGAGGSAGWAVSSGSGLSLSSSSNGGPTGGNVMIGTRLSGTGSLMVDYGGSSGTTVYIPVEAGKTYTSSAWASPTVTGTQSFGILTRFYNAAGAQVDSNTSNGVVNVANDTWRRWSRTDVAPAGAVRARVVVIINGSTSITGDTLKVTQVMVTEGSTLYNFADGTSPNWTWNGTPHASTSTGPPQ